MPRSTRTGKAPKYESYEPIGDAVRFDRAVAPQQGESLEAPLLFLDVEPWPHQREMLEKLAVERERHHRFKNLVVAAHGNRQDDRRRAGLQTPVRSARRSTPAVCRTSTRNPETEPWRIPPGTIRDEQTTSDLFLVTFEQSEREYSPSTLYKDCAILPTLFHGEAQSTTTQQSKTWQRCIHHRTLGGNILAFVRPRRKLGDARCHTRSSAPQTTSRTRASGQSALFGDCGDRCLRISSGRRRWPAANVSLRTTQFG